jgi:anti-sigma-K factor RskA
MTGPVRADIHALTGAYVLDAVSDVERAEFERHLTRCETCAQEVAELRETATRLALAAAAEPPRRLRQRVLASIGATRQSPRASDVPRSPARRLLVSKLAVRLTAAAAAALLTATTMLGVLVVRQQHTLDDIRARGETMAALLNTGDTRVITQTNPSGTRMTAIVSRGQDRVLLLADDLPPPPAGHDYQAWKIATSTSSAGLLTPDNGHALLDLSGIGSVTHIGITIEPTGGSTQPTTNPIMRLDLT